MTKMGGCLSDHDTAYITVDFGNISRVAIEDIIHFLSGLILFSLQLGLDPNNGLFRYLFVGWVFGF